MTEPDARLSEVVLHADRTIRCSTIVPTDDEGEPITDDPWPQSGLDGAMCGRISRYQVARSDGDESFGINSGSDEACDLHLAYTIVGMLDGDEKVRAIVTVRWDA